MIPIKNNKLEARVFGLPRSGHHGVIVWLTGHFTGEVLHYNDVAIAERGHAEQAHVLMNNDSAEFRDLYVFNVEDRDLSWAAFAIDTNRWDTYKGPSEVTKHILVLRDPYNNFASYIKMFGMDQFFSRGIVARWKQYALEFLGETSFLPKDTVRVSYSDWFVSEEYRRLLSARLGLVFSDAKLHEPYGAGSAFDEYIPDARARKVLERWQHFAVDPMFLSVFSNDQELNELAALIFGEFAVNIRKNLVG